MRQERFEVKYQFPLDRLDELVAFIRPFMAVDKYSDCRDLRGAYKILSVYYDSPDFDFYHSHREGHPSRRKVRVRKYYYRERSHYFLEIKNKVLFSTNKYRLKLGDDLLKNAAECRDFEQLFELFLDKYTDNPVAGMVHFDLLTLKLRPVLCVSYNRLAYSSNFEHDVRLTVDFNIEASKAKNFLRFKHCFPPQRIFPDYLGILELKSNRIMPRWLQDVILHFGLTRRSFSKYKEGIEKIYEIF